MKLTKVIATLCSVTMMCTSVAFAALEEISDDSEISLFAETQVFDGGTGTVEDPFLISSEEQLKLINDLPSSSFRLLNDINLTEDWYPVGYDGEAFSGTIYGDNHCINNVNTVNLPYNGFIYETTSDSIIKNLIIKTGDNGKITAQSTYTNSNCKTATVGGLVAKNNGYIVNCGFEGNIYAKIWVDAYKSYDSGNVGGLCGINNGEIQNCYAIGSMTVYKNNSYTTSTGGFVGNNLGHISNCFARINTVKEGSDYNFRSNGFSGYNDGYIVNCYSTGIASYGFCYSNGEFDNCIYDKQISGCSDTYNAEPKNTLAMKIKNTYTNWNFDDVWDIDSNINDGYPYLRENLMGESIKSLQIDKNSAIMLIGSTLPLNVVIEPVGTTRKVLWTSNNSDIASVSDNGVVTANSPGNAIISASIGMIKADCTIEVTDTSIKITDITLDKSNAGIVIGETLQLTANVVPEDATNTGINWTSTNPSIATVSDSGVVTGVAVGTAQIYATSVSNSACYAICDITVAAQKVAVTGIEFSDNIFNTPYEVNIGKSLTLSPTIKPSDATNKDIKWTSNDSSIATVTNGKVTGIAEGSTTITATTVDGGYSASVTVKVTKPTVYVTGIALNTEQMTVDVKATKKLIAAVTPADATDKTITFKSNNNAIANVSSDGTVTGVSPGTTLVQVISDTSSGKFIAFCTVTVPKPIIEVTSVKLDKGSLEIVEGKTVPLKTIIKPTNATYKNITWSTSDESIATVSQDGYVTAQGVGEAVVSATAVNGVNVICNITVLPSDTPAQLKVEDATVKAGKQVPITISIASNPGISTFNFDLTYDNTKLYPVSYTKGDALENVNIVTPLGSQSFKDRNSVRFLCSTTDSKNMDTDGDLITVVFQTLNDIEYGEETIGIVPTAFTNQNYENINLQEDNCTLSITDYIIGDVNNDDVVDLKDSMILGQYIAGFGNELTPQGKKAAISIYPDEGDDVETSEPTINDFQHLFRYLADWQVELGKN